MLTVHAKPKQLPGWPGFNPKISRIISDRIISARALR